jgi:two-component system CheB/CheR fusion protein
VNYYNQRWYQYTGLTFEQSKEWGWKVVVHPDDLEETISKYEASLHSGNIFEIENRQKGADGTYRWFLNRSMPLRNENGEIVYWIGTATDIDERKRELERKDEFIGVASHELKTPLTSLKGYLQLMKLQTKDNFPPVFSTYLAKVNIVADKLQHLVDDLLDVSKINAGRLDYAKSSLNLKALIDSCIESSRLVYSGFSFELDNQHDYMVKANAERLEQVMANIINNAVKYSGGDKRVIVETKKCGDRVRVSITDFGIGLDEDQKKRIFDRFYRAEDKKYSINGLGMGLFICSQIIDTHGGIIDVESEPGKGSTFYFELPLEK